MKKLFLFALLSVFLFSCSDDKYETACWEFYVEDEEEAAYIAQMLRAQYSPETGGEKTEQEVEEMIQTLLSYTYCGYTESQVETALTDTNEIMRENYERGNIWCLIVYSCRRVR